MTIGLIAGTGFENFDAMMVENSLTLSTPWGAPSGPLLRGSLGGAPVLYLARHGKGHALAPHAINYRANIAALKESWGEGRPFRLHRGRHHRADLGPRHSGGPAPAH